MSLQTIIAISFLQGIKTSSGVENISAGETCECDAETAAWAVDGGHARYSKTKSSVDTEVTLDEFRAAVANLKKGDESDWTQSGKPDCNALRAEGVEVSARARDSLWAEMNPDA